MTNLKKYNIFITITTFTKLMIEVFIPLLLFNIGFKLNEILYFYLIQFITIFLTNIPITKIGQKITFKKLMIISSIIFSLTYFYINYLTHNMIKLIILSILNGLYLSTYWIGRHIYGISIIKEKKTTDNVSTYMIFGIIGSLPASYIGAFILEKYGYIVLSITILILSIISIFPLFKIKISERKNKINLKEIITTFPKQNYLFLLFDQLKFLTILLFPLYIYINIKNELKYIAITNIIIGLSSILYILYLAKKMDKNKKDYLKPMLIIMLITLLIKLNIKSSTLMLIIIFIEGISKTALDTIILRNTYSYKANYDNISYILFIEQLYSLFRIIILIIYLLIGINLKTILYIGTFSLFINTIIGFKQGKSGYKTDC